MSTVVFLAVLLAALLHAGWNALVKSGADKQIAMAAVVFGHVPPALVALYFVPAPAPQSYPYIVAGTFFHFGYQILLLNAYRIGDLTQVYPIARGTAPLVVAAVSIWVLGVDLSPLALAAIAVIAAGIISLSLTRWDDGQHNQRAGLIAIATGLFIAGYSLVDGIGARQAGTAIGFYSWLTIFNSGAFLLYWLVRRPALIIAVPTRAKTLFWIGGTASYAAYGLVIWSFTQAPIAMVTALRETSIIFALLLGVLVLREPLNWKKVASTLTTLLGVMLLRLTKS